MAASATSTISATIQVLASCVKLPSSSTTQSVKRLTPFKPFNPSISQSLKLSSATTAATTIRRRSFTCKSQANSTDSGTTNVQVLHVYEINDEDGGGPAYLRLSQKNVNSLGDLVPFTNKLYSGDLQKCLGITAGICMLIKHDEEKNGDRYEAISSLYFGDYGHITIQGPYLTFEETRQGPYITYEETYLAVTGGSGIFQGVFGQVKLKLKQIVFPGKLFYTFYLQGIPDLPVELLSTPVTLSPTVEQSPATKATDNDATIAKFTN